MKRVILSITAMCAGMILAANASAFGDFGGDSQSQNQGQGQIQGQSSVNKNYNTNKNTAVGVGVGVGIADANNEGNNTTSQNTVNINEAEYLKKSRVDIRNNPDINAPGLVANGDCMGSTSTGVSAGLAGATFGTTWTDDGCDTRYLSGYAAKYGGKDAGTRVLCLGDKMKLANPSLCNRVYDAATFKTTAGTKIDMTYRPGKDIVSNDVFDNGFWK